MLFHKHSGFKQIIKRPSCILLFIFLLLVFHACAQSPFVTLETDTYRYTIGEDGKNLTFIDKKTGTDYCNKSPVSFCAQVKLGDKTHNASHVSYKDSRLTLRFREPGVTVVLKTTVLKHSILLEVESVRGDVESLVFVNIPLTLGGRPSDPFGACSFALSTFTHVRQLPALQSHLWAASYREFGLTGAKVALIGVPREDMLTTIQDILTNSEHELPYTKLAGAWADEIPFNHGSYLFNFGNLTEENVDDWIEMAHSLGFNQIDNHGGGSFFRFGDFHLNEEKWPDGWDSFKRIVKKLHDAGIGSIFHTYAFFIDKRSKYVTPVPHPGLGSFRSFTLAEPISDDATEIKVMESTANINTITGFFVQNSITLHIDDELITFGGVTKEAPFTFTGCTRGAYGTKAASHKKDTKARHLKELFGLFAPDHKSDLFEEIARNHAEIINYCDFDGFYFDAIDGTGILDGGQNTWYWGPKFVFDVYKHLEKPIGMEMSAMWHHMWNFRTRWQAWDYPNRGYKRFIDTHANAVNSGLLLPMHLGWWNFKRFNPPQVEPTYTDVIEYMGCKLIGYNAGMSMHTAAPEYSRLVSLLKTYEGLRHDNYFNESVKAKLRQPGKDFTLFKDRKGKWRFRPVKYEKHKIEGLNHPTSVWQSTNDFVKQPLKLRIEALMSAGAYDAPDNIILEDFSNPKNITEHVTAAGVTSDVQPSSDQVKKGNVSGGFSAHNSGQVQQNAAWVKAHKTFDPWLDLGKHQALGVWIYGDGNGELINFRLGSPQHIAYGAVADRYVMVDFKGWRYFELIETESTRWSDYRWSDGKWLYNVYRERIHFDNVESLSIWYNNLPPNKEIQCYLSPVKALPMVSSKFKNPSITVNGKTIVFPVEMESGSYIEFYSNKNCILYGPKGEIIKKFKPKGSIPDLLNGSNEISFSCETDSGLNPRTQITVIVHGEPL